MAEILPYRMGMDLGRTYDLRNHTVGVDLFPYQHLSTAQTIQCPSTIIRYSVIKSSSDVHNLLEVSGDISLKVKAGLMQVNGMGSYLKDKKAEENTLEILAVAHVETLSTTLMNPQPDNSQRKMGTHYIRSITYGGDLVISIRINASDSNHLKEIQVKVGSGLQVFGVLDIGAKANLKKIEQDLKGSSEIKFSYYSTTSCTELPNDVNSMLKALENFQNQLTKINDGKGAPLKCELVPLAHLDPHFPKVLRNTGIETQLRELEEIYDEIVQAKDMLQQCLNNNVEYMTEQQLVRWEEIDKKIKSVMHEFNNVISTLDVTTDGDSMDKIQQALDYYCQNKRPGGFMTEVKLFLKTIHRPLSTCTSGTPVKDLPPGESLHILLVGKTGHGKSATANSIFGERLFKSDMTNTSVSRECQMETRTVGGRNICLVDTPGTMDTKHPKRAFKQLMNAITRQPDGYHAFLFVVNIDVKITDEEEKAIEMLKKLFGPDVIVKFGVFVFTHGDSFEKNMALQDRKSTFLEYIKSQEGYIRTVLTECNYRCAVIDNLGNNPGIKRDQVINIIKMIDELVTANNNKKYTNDLFEMAKVTLEKELKELYNIRAKLERMREEEIASIRKERKTDGKEQIAEVQAKYSKLLKMNEKKMESARLAVCKKTAQQAILGGGCFPSDALVRLEDGRNITMANLRTGQNVLSSSSSGTLEYSEVFFFAHLNPNTIHKYIIVKSSKQAIKLTPEHHIYIVRHGQAKTVAAKEVKIGDNMLVLDKTFSSLAYEPVVEMFETTQAGVYAPITMSGSIIVNNVLASCYVDMVSPVYSHAMLWPMRQLYVISPSITAWVNDIGKEGMPVWVKWIMDNILA